MRWAVIAGFGLVGCSEHGSRGLETLPLVPQLCTSGNPGEATCPRNVVDLGTFVEGARFLFVARPLDTGLELTSLVAAGPRGLGIEHLQVVVFENGVEVQDVELSPIVVLKPNDSIEVGQGTKIVVETTPPQMSLRASSAEPLR
jgi:hypothetical protein